MSDFGSESALDMCIEWLEADDTCRLRRNDSLRVPEPPQARLETIVTREAVDLWREFRRSRNQGDSLRASHFILRLCASTREAAIIGAAADPTNDELVRWATLQNLRENSANICGYLDMYTRRLNASFEKAMGPGEYGRKALHTGYFNAAGLAVAHTVERAATEGRITLPAPGQSIVPGDTIREWDRDL